MANNSDNKGNKDKWRDDDVLKEKYMGFLGFLGEGFIERLAHLSFPLGFVLVLLLVVLGVGSVMTTVPLFFLGNTWENVDEHRELEGVRPYTALELAGRDIYVREGCYTCHSQMIRPFRDETMRYGHYSLAVESMYDHPFQWGSKRTGPDLARVGGKYSDEWHERHFMRPQEVVPESVMPAYPWLKSSLVNADGMPKRLSVMRLLGVPYSEEEIDGSAEATRGRTEMEALIAYMQSLGTMVKLDPAAAYRP